MAETNFAAGDLQKEDLQHVIAAHYAMIYHFEDFELDSDQHELRRDGEPLKMEPQVFALLSYFVKNPDRLITKDEIVEKIWDGRFISDAAINSRIRSARNVIDDDGKTQRLIKTVHSRGFRFVGEITQTENDSSSVGENQPNPSIRPMATITGSEEVEKSKTNMLAIAAIAAVILLVGIFSIYQWSSADNRNGHAAQPEEFTASIAVLPFSDMSSDSDQQYLGDGIAEELLNVLVRVDGLKVTSRTSAFAFRDKGVRISEIGQALGVRHVLEGSVRQAGNTIRVTAQLIDANSDAHVWSETYDRPMTSETILKVQDEIAATIVAELMGQLSLPDSISRPQVASIEAYEFYLRARELMRKSTPESLKTAIGLYENTTALDPDYAPAYAGLAHAHSLTEFYAGTPVDLVVKNMKPHVERALALAPKNPEVLVAAAKLASMEGRNDDALQYFDEAVNVAPKHADAHKGRGDILALKGAFEESLAAFEEARIHDPLSPAILGNIALRKFDLGDIEGAKEATEVNLKWNSDAAQALNMMARLERNEGNYVEAHKLLLRATSTNANEFNVQHDLAMLYADIGLHQQAIEAAKIPATREKVRATIGEGQLPSKIGDYDAAYQAYLMGETRAAYPIFRKDVDNYEFLKGGAIGRNELLWVAEYVFVLDSQSDPDAQILLRRLEDLANKVPTDQIRQTDALLGRVAIRMLRDDPKGALEWLDRLIDKGHVFLHLSKNPIFAPLKNTPGFALRQRTMEENAAQYRTKIRKQRSSD